MKSKKFISMVLAVAAAFSLCIPTMAISDLEPQKAMEVKDFYGDASDFNTSLADYTEDNRIMSDISAEPYIVDETIVNNDIKADMAAITAITSDDASYVMTGESGTTLLVDSISSQDYRNLMNVLYPDGVIDEQGQDIPSIENAAERRAQFIAEHMRAYSVVDGETREVN